jgi:RecT family protein
MAVQVGIDGYRLIAERTGRYAPGRETTFEYKDGQLFSATAYVKKQTTDGTWHEFSSTAFLTEYAAYTKDKSLTHMWASKPHIMLGKCAEACALRKGFPAELSGIYTKEEMEQADNPKMESAEAHVIEVIPYDPTRDDEEIKAFAKSQGMNDIEAVKAYLVKFATHYKKSMSDTIQYYLDSPDKFLSAYHAWIAKNTNG